MHVSLHHSSRCEADYAGAPCTSYGDVEEPRRFEDETRVRVPPAVREEYCLQGPGQKQLALRDLSRRALSLREFEEARRLSSASIGPALHTRLREQSFAARRCRPTTSREVPRGSYRLAASQSIVATPARRQRQMMRRGLSRFQRTAVLGCHSPTTLRFAHRHLSHDSARSRRVR